MKAAVRLPTPLRPLAQSGSLTKSGFAKSPKRASLMSISLYDLSVPTFLQTVNALAGVLDRADEHCAKMGHDPDDFVEVRLIDDMAPFHFQIEAAWHHAGVGDSIITLTNRNAPHPQDVVGRDNVEVDRWLAAPAFPV